MSDADLIKFIAGGVLSIVSLLAAYFTGGNKREKKIKLETDKRDFESMQDVSKRTESIISADRDEYARRLHDSTRKPIINAGSNGMFKFSSRSKERLSAVDIRLADLIEDALAVSPIDFGIPLHGGLRTKEEQKALFDDRKSKFDGYLNSSKHQSGKAVDIFAYVNGKATWDKEYYYTLAGIIWALAEIKGLKIRWGGSWSGSFDFKDQTFNDLGHFEIID